MWNFYSCPMTIFVLWLSGYGVEFTWIVFGCEILVTARTITTTGNDAFWNQWFVNYCAGSIRIMIYVNKPRCFSPNNNSLKHLPIVAFIFQEEFLISNLLIWNQSSLDHLFSKEIWKEIFFDFNPVIYYRDVSVIIVCVSYKLLVNIR